MNATLSLTLAVTPPPEADAGALLRRGIELRRRLTRTFPRTQSPSPAERRAARRIMRSTEAELRTVTEALEALGYVKSTPPCARGGAR